MVFPHPKSRAKNYGKEDKPNSGRVVWNLFKRTIDIADYRSAKDNVNRAKNRTLVSLSMILFDESGWVVGSISNSGICKERTHFDR
jgi:hypothetical protein